MSTWGIRVNLGIIGLGAISSFYLKAIEDSRDFTLTAACDISDAALARVTDQSICQFSDTAAMLDSGLFDAVVVALPNDLHRNTVVKALENGIHVCCEKPLSVSPSDSATMTAAAQATGSILFTAFHRRYNKNLRNLIGRLPSSEEISAVSIRYNENIVEHSVGEAWYLDARRCGGGCLIDNGPNALDVASQIVGPLEVRDATIGDVRSGAEFLARISLSSRSGVPVSIELDWSLVTGEEKDVTVTFRDGSTDSADMLSGFTGFKSSLFHEYQAIMADFRRAIITPGSWHDNGHEIVNLVADSYRIARSKEVRLRMMVKNAASARIVRVLVHIREDRRMSFAPWQSRCFTKGEIHEIVTTTDTPENRSVSIDHIGFVGFAEFSQASVVEVGDQVFIGELYVGSVAGFDECHYPNHYNIIVSSDRLICGSEINLRPGDEVSFVPAEVLP